MSGLSHTPGKRAWGKTHRGFESRLLRQLSLIPCALSILRQCARVVKQVDTSDLKSAAS